MEFVCTYAGRVCTYAGFVCTCAGFVCTCAGYVAHMQMSVCVLYADGKRHGSKKQIRRNQ